MSEETPPPLGPWQQRARTVLRLWCWVVFGLIVLSFVMGAISGSALTRNPMAGVWWLLFGGYALRKGGLLDLPGGHRKAAWVAGALTLFAIISIAYGPGLKEIVAPAWVYALRAALALSPAVLTIALILAAREAKDPSPFETWPACRPDRRRSASVAALVIAAAFMVLGVLGLFGVIGGENTKPGLWLIYGVFYGGVLLLAGIQMWFGRWVAITVGILVPLCMIMAVILGSMGFAGFIPLNLAIPGSIGALVCTVFLIRGVTCRPAPM